MNFIETLLQISVRTGYTHVYMVQQYSMRRYDTNEYELLYDGNLNLTLNRLYLLPPNFTVSITVPINHNKQHLAVLKVFIAKHIKCKVQFIEMTYGLNAVENRKIVPMFADQQTMADTIMVSDFSGSKYADIYTFNVSKVPDFPRDYVDSYIVEMQAVQDTPIFVLNENQLELLPRATVQDKLMSKVLLEEQFKYYSTLEDSKPELDIIKQLANGKPFVFFPFRISDKAYQFEFVKAMCELSGRLLVITDPNSSTKDMPGVWTVQAQNKKAFYVNMLLSDLDYTIECYEDFFKVVHQSMLEMVHFVPTKFKFNCTEISQVEYNTKVAKLLY